MTKRQFPQDILNALQGSYGSYQGPYGSHRTCPEKQFALALLAGRVMRLELSDSYWCSGPPTRGGCLIAENSIMAYGGIDVSGTHLLWALLEYLDIPFSGGGDRGYAQASWLPTETKHPRPEFYTMSLPMVVHYFNTMKGLKE